MWRLLHYRSRLITRSIFFIGTSLLKFICVIIIGQASMKLILITGILIVMIFTPRVILGAKMVILSFDESTFGQYTVAKPILDKYGFKGTFFTVCNFIGTTGHMNWTQINTLQKEGHDIDLIA